MKITPNILIAAGIWGQVVAYCLLLAGCGSSSRATAIIDGPRSAKPGDIVVLSAESSTGQVFEWTADADCQIREFDGGRRIVLAPKKTGEHHTRLKVLSAAGGVLTSASTEHVLVVGDGPSPPNPGPGPGPGPGPTPPAPQPDLPPGRFGLALFTKTEAERLVQSGARASEARRIAEDYRTIAAQIAAGTLGGAVEINQATLIRQEAAGPSWQAFWPVLAGRVGPALRGGQAPVSDIAEAWREIATGLEAVR